MNADHEAMLLRLCLLAGVPAEEHATVAGQQAMMVNGMAVQFRLEEWSGFVKIYVEAGRPAPSRLPALCQSILEQQLELPVPFVMLTALDAASGALILVGCAPMPSNRVEDEELLAFLHACVDGATLLRRAMDGEEDRVTDLTAFHYF
ncbi:hypothetical protein [Noviherbaspirillum soli]|uniref:hypothetical protein n=1 Tax=Noviherbaspirillum soli TaxID=1064518 RepID=UPI001889EBC4|nr:hypothetical protein [Noviherbaspirillum soli]